MKQFTAAAALLIATFLTGCRTEEVYSVYTTRPGAMTAENRYKEVRNFTEGEAVSVLVGRRYGGETVTVKIVNRTSNVVAGAESAHIARRKSRLYTFEGLSAGSYRAEILVDDFLQDTLLFTVR